MSLSSQAGEAEAGELLEPRSSDNIRKHLSSTKIGAGGLKRGRTLISGVDKGRGDVRMALSMAQTGFSVGICRSKDPDKAT